MTPRGPVEVRLCGGVVAERWLCAECGRAVMAGVERCPRCGAVAEWERVERFRRSEGQRG